MAGNGPAPAAERRRRNKERFEELPAEGYQGRFPRLPRTYRSERAGRVSTISFLKATREWYETWARSPMATEFTGVNWERLKRVARIVDQYERIPDPKLLAEIRLQEAAFGGTPLDLRRLGRKVAPPAATSSAQPPPRQQSVSRRARLSVVK